MSETGKNAPAVINADRNGNVIAGAEERKTLCMCKRAVW